MRDLLTYVCGAYSLHVNDEYPTRTQTHPVNVHQELVFNHGHDLSTHVELFLEVPDEDAGEGDADGQPGVERPQGRRRGREFGERRGERRRQVADGAQSHDVACCLY